MIQGLFLGIVFAGALLVLIHALGSKKPLEIGYAAYPHDNPIDSREFWK